MLQSLVLLGVFFITFIAEVKYFSSDSFLSDQAVSVVRRSYNYDANSSKVIALKNAYGEEDLQATLNASESIRHDYRVDVEKYRVTINTCEGITQAHLPDYLNKVTEDGLMSKWEYQALKGLMLREIEAGGCAKNKEGVIELFKKNV